MKKFCNDGKVAVIIHPAYVGGWYSKHYIKEMLFDPDIVQLILEKPSDFVEKILDILVERYQDRIVYNIRESWIIKSLINELEISWVEEGKPFQIKEYNGYETVVLIDDLDFDIHIA